MRDIDLGWLAGILEGEGYFGAQSSKPSWRPKLRVHLKMTDRDVIERAIALFPPGPRTDIRQETSPSRPEGWKDIYYVVWCSQRAEDLMRAVRPLMSSRRGEKIDRLLALDLSHHKKAKK